MCEKIFVLATDIGCFCQMKMIYSSFLVAIFVLVLPTAESNGHRVTPRPPKVLYVERVGEVVPSVALAAFFVAVGSANHNTQLMPPEHKGPSLK